jgi:anti-sigma regulatory factor (Ser/Thr protein kinase)
MPVVATRRVQARLAEVQVLADFVEATVLPLSRDASLKLRLMVEELFVNTICHGHGGDSDAPVEVTIRVGHDTVDVIYVDAAPAFDPFADVERPDTGAGVNARPVGHLGVYIITRLADRYGYERAGNGNRVTLHVRVAPPAADPGPSR